MPTYGATLGRIRYGNATTGDNSLGKVLSPVAEGLKGVMGVMGVMLTLIINCSLPKEQVIITTIAKIGILGAQV